MADDGTPKYVTEEVFERRLDAVDRRFDAVDRRFDAVDRRFDAVDQKFDLVMQRFDTAEATFKHQIHIFVEHFDSSVKTVLEGMTAMEERLERKWEERFERIETRLDIIEIVLRDHSVRLQRLEGAVGQIQADVTELRRRLESVEQIVDAIQRDHSIAELEQRVRVLEERLGIEKT